MTHAAFWKSITLPFEALQPRITRLQLLRHGRGQSLTKFRKLGGLLLEERRESIEVGECIVRPIEVY
jgi:hypothetical protein